MSKTAIIKIRVTPEEKAAFESVVRSGGLDPSKALREFVQHVATGGAVPVRAWAE